MPLKFLSVVLLVAAAMVGMAASTHVVAQQRAGLPDNPRLKEAAALFQQGKAAARARQFDKAIPFFEQALALRERALGSGHRDLVPITDSLGAAHRERGEYAKALAYYERSLAIDEKTLGPDHADVAEDLNALAGLYELMGEHAKALPLRERSRAIRGQAASSARPLFDPPASTTGPLSARRPGVASSAPPPPPPASGTFGIISPREQESAEAQRSQAEEARARAAIDAAARQTGAASEERGVAQRAQAENPYARAAAEAAARQAMEVRTAAPKVAAKPSETRRPLAGALPDFPWPPPAPSAQAVLPNSLFQASGKPAPTLSSVGAQLVGALERARYFEYGYYRVPAGFALVARLERIRDDGTPLPEEFRFLLPGSQEPFSLAAYVKQLFFAPAGFYRQIVFAVTDQPFAATGEKLDAAAAANLLSEGANRLSKDFETMSFTEAHRVSALIYEFRKGATQGDVSTLTPGRLGARTHLERAGIYQVLAPQR